MSVIIENTLVSRTETRTEFTTVSYVAQSREECKDSVDASVYDLVVLFGDMIRMGQVIGRPA